VNEPYERIVELARREAVLVGEGSLEGLAAVWAERDQLVASLPAVPPASARASLLEAQRVNRATHERLLELLGELGGQIAQLSSGRRAVAGYAGTAAPRALDAHG